MSNWEYLPPDVGIHSVINTQFGEQNRPDRIIYPDLNDGSGLVLATTTLGRTKPQISASSASSSPLRSLSKAFGNRHDWRCGGSTSTTTGGWRSRSWTMPFGSTPSPPFSKPQAN